MTKERQHTWSADKRRDLDKKKMRQRMTAMGFFSGTDQDDTDVDANYTRRQGPGTVGSNTGTLKKES